MRVRGIHLAGLAAALVGTGAASQAKADDLTVNSATTTPVITSAANNSTAGNVTVTSSGKITVTTGETAITVDSSNNVSNAGTLNSNDVDGTTGVLIQGGNVGPNTITNSGTISLLETYVPTDTDSDGDLDGVWAQGTNRNGVWLGAGSTFNGDIVHSGAINIQGNNSAGIRLDALLNGDLNSTGGFAITGDHSAAILIDGGAAGGVTGDVTATGSVSVRGLDSSGMIVNAPITGALRINGNWAVTGFHSVTVPADTSHLDTDPLTGDFLIGGDAVGIHYSVLGGVTIQGIGVEDDEDDDHDTLTTTDTNDNLSATITSFGSSPALNIAADPSANLVLGPVTDVVTGGDAAAGGTGFGLYVRGTVSAQGVFGGIDSTAIRLIGTSTSTVTTSAGVAIDGVVTAIANGGNATAIEIGDAATVPTLRLRRSIASSVTSDAAKDAIGVSIASGGTLNTFSNSGTLQARYFGETGNATGIVDHSGSLSVINNTGTISATITATDANTTDNIPPPAITGSAVAIDVSNSTTGLTINQTPDVVFTDDDTTDNDSAARPAVTIVGDIRFGIAGGDDTINLHAGTIDGNVAFGAGADVFDVDGGATYTGLLTKGAGTLDVTVENGTLNLRGGAQTDITNATFGAQSVLGVNLDATSPTNIVASGAVTFATGARIVPTVPNGLPDSGTLVFLTAGSLDAAAVEGTVSGAGVPFVYNLNIDQVGNQLAADYQLKSAAELGFNRNQTAAYAPVIEAVKTDTDVANAIASLDTESAFFRAYNSLLPSYSSAAAEMTATAVQQSQSATTNRLATTRVNNAHEVSVWAQEIGYALTRTPEDVDGQQFDGHGFGFAGGIDGPLDNGALFGLSISFVASEMEEKGRPEGEISTSLGQANAYLGTAFGPVDLDLVGGLGIGRMSERRFVSIGTFSGRTDADWWAYEGHGALRASVPMNLGWLVVSPQAALTYVALQEQGYTEKGGGTAIDIEADSQFSQRLWADVGVDFSARIHRGSGSTIVPHIYAGYRANAIDEQAERTFRFVSTGTDFTLVDDDFGPGGPLVGFGIDASNGYSTFSLSYEGEFSDQIDRNSLNASIRFRF